MNKTVPYEPIIFLYNITSSHIDMKSDPKLEIFILKQDSLIKVTDFSAEISFGKREPQQAYIYSTCSIFDQDTNGLTSTHFKNIPDEYKYPRKRKYQGRDPSALFARPKKLTKNATIKISLELETSQYTFININITDTLRLRIVKLPLRRQKTCFEH
jgi:hypothetical protein